MKTSRLSFFAFFIFCGSLLAQESSIAKFAAKVEALEGKVSDLTSELTATKAKLKEVSKIVMTGRLELTANLASNGKLSLVGKGLNGEELGGNDLNDEEFVQKLRSISEQYPNPKMAITDFNKLTEKDQEFFTVRCARAGIYTITAVNAKNEVEQDGGGKSATRPESK
jgi:hypothetical protein